MFLCNLLCVLKHAYIGTLFDKINFGLYHTKVRNFFLDRRNIFIQSGILTLASPIKLRPATLGPYSDFFLSPRYDRNAFVCILATCRAFSFPYSILHLPVGLVHAVYCLAP